MTETTSSDTTFNIGITMAGAGSAGCYTAGVMDYLFEILDLWEKAKNKKLSGYEEFYPLIPQHNVLIDVMGGTSAGGIATIMSTIYALNGPINPVKDPLVDAVKRNNILYDSWVMLDDDSGENGKKTLDKAWTLEDLQDNKFVSLLNSRIIDDIADQAFEITGKIEEQVPKLPSYFSKDIDVLLSHTMLRGIPLGISFSTPIGDVKGVADLPEHNTFEHFTVSHYKLNEGKKPNPKKFLWLNPYEKASADIMRLTTKATGAFPIGLRFREIDSNTFNDDYIKCVTQTIIYNRFGQKNENNNFNWANFPAPFNFVTIDGGAINNEPFGEVLGILKSRYHECIENGYPKYGIIMIDPFPDVVDKNKEYVAPDDIFSVVPAIIGTLHDQSKVKRGDMVEAAEHPYYRGEIFPRRWLQKDVKDEHPIACGSASAFGGFLDIKFRHYDFFLGRDNARNYFRYFFSFEYTIDENDSQKSVIHPIHSSWTPEMVEIFKVTGKDGKTYLPIIPDLNILEEKKAGNLRNPFEYSIPNRPQYDPLELFNLRQQMENRFEKILDISKLKLTQKSNAAKNIETEKWMNKYYHKSWFDNVKGWIINKSFNLIFSVTKGGLARNITQMALKWVLSDLEKKKFLKKY